MIRFEDLSIQFKKKVVLDHVDLHIAEGETMVVIGPSGSGKSTLLRLVVGLVKPTDGKIWVAGTEIGQMKEEELGAVRLGMGMVFQYSALFDSMSVGENVAFGLRQHTKLTEEEVQAVIRERLKMVGLDGYQNAMPNELSGGMKKRVSLARALAFEPKIILYDEPSSGLDPIMSRKIDELILTTQKKLGVTSLVVTHDMESAFRIADRIAVLYEGTFAAVGTPDEIRRSEHPFVKNFIRGTIDVQEENEVIE